MVSNRLRYLVGALVAGALAWPVHAQQNGLADLSFGSVAMDVPAAMHQRLKPLTDYLSRELKRPVRLKLSPELSAAADDVAAGRVDIAYLTPVAYIKARKKGEVRLVVKTVTKGEQSFRLMIVVRHDSPIRTVHDLKGKNFAFGDPAAILQRAVVVNAGIRLEELGSYKFIGHLDNIARGIANGDFDAGILKDTSAIEWEKKGLRVIHASPPLPPFNIVVGPHVSEPLYHKIREALLALKVSNLRHHEVLKALDPSYDGFAPATDAEYDVVRQFIKPFEK